MQEISKQLEQRKEKLLEWKKQIENFLLTVPEGSLRLCKHRNSTQYYHRLTPDDTNGIYIPKENRNLAQILAQKNYYQKALSSIKEELNALQKYFASYPSIIAEDIYPSLHEKRQQLITPLYESDAEYLKKWESTKLEGRIFFENMPEFYTDKGERVRSKSEVIIANSLNKEEIPYHYEQPIYLPGLGTVYPDFRVLNIRERKEYIWEHFGMMDDADYARKAIQKIDAYEKNGFAPGENMIMTFETGKTPLSQRTILLMIDTHLK